MRVRDRAGPHGMALALMLKKHPLAKCVEVGTAGHLWASCWLHQDPSQRYWNGEPRPWSYKPKECLGVTMVGGSALCQS